MSGQERATVVEIHLQNIQSSGQQSPTVYDMSDSGDSVGAGSIDPEMLYSRQNLIGECFIEIEPL